MPIDRAVSARWGEARGPTAAQVAAGAAPPDEGGRRQSPAGSAPVAGPEQLGAPLGEHREGPPLIDKDGRPPPLLAIQRGLETLYRVEACLDVNDFLLTKEQREGLFPGRQPEEQLLLREHEEGLDLALYLEGGLLETLADHDPREGINGTNLQALLHVLEGVSHFIYTVDRARSRRTLSVLELELQAEVDKYVVLVMLLWEEGAPPMARPVALTDLLFRQIAYRADLSGEEMERYTAANAAAHRYALSLQRRYLRHRALPLFLSDVRHFWRLSLTGKLSHITCSS